MSNSFKQRPTYFSRRSENFVGGEVPLRSPGYGPVFYLDCFLKNGSSRHAAMLHEKWSHWLPTYFCGINYAALL